MQMPTNHHSCNEHIAINHGSPLTAGSPMPQIDRESTNAWTCGAATSSKLSDLSLVLTVLLIQLIPDFLAHLFLATDDGGKGIKACVLLCKERKSKGLKIKGKHFKDRKICVYTYIHIDRHTHTHRGTSIQASDAIQHLTRVTPWLAIPEQNLSTYFMPHPEMTSR